jgi:hypothetical protein
MRHSPPPREGSVEHKTGPLFSSPQTTPLSSPTQSAVTAMWIQGAPQQDFPFSQHSGRCAFKAICIQGDVHSGRCAFTAMCIQPQQDFHFSQQDSDKVFTAKFSQGFHSKSFTRFSQQDFILFT